MFYSNGSGGEARRCVVLNNVTAGDGISVYTGPSNAANSGVEFKYLGTEGEQNDEKAHCSWWYTGKKLILLLSTTVLARFGLTLLLMQVSQ